ncbi:MAG TPA: Asp-tRNA(Asn)/Glu-tRNA(Gln) amidotransferase subunit GatB [Verrucomicrobiae bacterium]|jgi:aspartyl-tRNA(Asn)/glutamyl-tRNA(Gln) amidotransferase subunit B|nr:Asp-tRNA(Asn)/Glu-tRNA(Gln) amidotransferase subunit GatB [Verrucomicrobiae bacterium]
MIGPETRAKYRTTIGIECHVQLKTKTKLFSAVGNDAREAPPNTLVSHIDFGLPGALPVLNAEAIHLATRAAFALGTEPERFSKFDRKHYFYPDLPKGYQISQFDEPIIGKGAITVDVNGEAKVIGITRAHLEEDAGKSTHQAGKDYSLVDLNRAGKPLLEIVSEPDMHTSAEAKAYARELYLRMRYADVSDANLYYGNMRFDVNVSVSQTDELGTRSETKNLNSFRSVEKAVEYEVTRQIELLEKGGRVVQETRGWDDAKQKTFSQRSKENADDYRYMPDPDLPPIVITDDYVAKIKAEMPIMPAEWRDRLSSLELDKAQIETLLEAEAESEHVSYLTLIEANLDKPELAKFLANWYVNVKIPLVRENKIKLESSQHQQVELAIYELLKANKLSSTNAKALFENITGLATLPNDIEAYAQEKGYIQVSDEGEIAKIVEQAITDNPQAAEDVKNGETKAIGFLVGQVMKASKGKANPSLAQELIKKQLGI